MGDPTSDDDDRLRTLGRELPWDRPDDARREAVRSSLLLAAREQREAPRSRWPLIGGGFVAGALAAAAVTLVIVRPHGDRGSAMAVAPVAAVIEAPATAEYEREVVHDGQGHLAEIVRVRGGLLKVASAHPGEHVQLTTADARVDGEGSYEVEVAEDRLRTLHVLAGSATLRLRDHQVVILAAGERWEAKVVTARIELPRVEPGPSPLASAPQPQQPSPLASAPQPPQPSSLASAQPQQPSPLARGRAPEAVDRVPEISRRAPEAAIRAPESVSRETSAVEKPSQAATEARTESEANVRSAAGTDKTTEAGQVRPRGPSVTEQHFATGWQLLKQGKAAEAARQLGAAADSDDDPALAADARYLQAVALTRAGRKTEAEHALVAFLDHAPHSLRRGRAAVMLARLIAERGDTRSARAWYTSALHDPDAGVVAEAKAGLESLPVE